MKCVECNVEEGSYYYDGLHLCWECLELYMYVDMEKKEKLENKCELCGTEGITLYDGLYLCEKCLWIAREKKFNKIHCECESCGEIVFNDELTLVHFEKDEEHRECDKWICKKCCSLK
jgi:ribosomal protein S14